MKKRLAFVVTLSLVVMMLAGQVFAQNYPTKQINLIIQAAPGGLSDLTARTVGSVASEILGVPIVFTNRPGAAGAVAMSYVKESRPDGYTIGYVPVELAMVEALGYAQDLNPSSFDLICASNIAAATITVRADSGWETLEDLVEWCKANPGKLRVGNSGTGSVWYVAGASWAKAAGIEVNHVPFDGAAPAVAAIMGKHIDMVPVSEMEVRSGVESGELRILAVLSDERSQYNPDVPTLKELGYDITVAAWGGFAAPKGVPAEILAVLEDAFGQGVQSERFAEVTKANGYSAFYLNSEDFTNFATQQYEFYTELFKELGH
ncbi:MAG: tripartite tricarboxylate transporter substrate binding protein [Bacillota bacterium]|nr:tripartite tricarboxylate transporter substrate binding protein [Bacillota bacterium]NLJ02060.1 tripartite tricarboxylate transporter substrate binding protein [Bacillota bacterium]